MNFRMIRIFLILFCIGLGLTACKPAPDAYDAQDNPVSFSAFRGQYILINYFAEWCKPCSTEIPALNAFYLQHKGKVMVFGVNYDRADDAKLKGIIKKMGIKFPVLKDDPGQKFGIMSVEGLPMTVVINPKGEKINSLMGEQTEKTLSQATGL